MLPLEIVLAGAILVSLTLYVLFAGADFGAGVWFLFARGKHADAERRLITEAIGPVWEANHVWLILVVVLLFTAFPPAFARISILLHIPLAVMLIGIVLRGSAFVFRNYDIRPEEIHRLWERIFALSSVITPFLLGVTIGAIASGRLTMEGNDFLQLYVWPWLQPFPLAVGCFAFTLFALLAAVYLIQETQDPVLQNLFGRRALWTAGVSAVLALIVLWLAREGAPEISYGLSRNPWGIFCLISAGLAGLCAIVCLWTRHYLLARASVVLQVCFILWGWALSQYPFLVEPDLTVFNAAAPESTLVLILVFLIMGSLLLFPSLFYLFRIFKGHAIFPGSEESADRKE
jgi:cytochrome bd ubiquinol oxidase subunit II